MNKHNLSLLLVTILIGSCAPATASPTQPPAATATQTVAPSRTPPPTQTAIPETQEQILHRVVEAELATGANPNNPDTWGKSTEGSNYVTPEGHTMQQIAEDPNTKSDAELNIEHDYVTGLRKKTFEQLVSNDATRPMFVNALQRYLTYEAFGDSVFSQNNPAQMSIDGLKQFVLGFTSDQLSDLDRNLCNNNGEVFRPTAKELIEWSTKQLYEKKIDPGTNVLIDPGTNVLYKDNVDDKANVIGKGPMGMWIRDSFWDKFYQDTITYLVPVFGRTEFNGKLLTRYGDWGGDSHQGIYGGPLDLPYNKAGALLIMIHPSGAVQKLSFEVNTDKNPPVTISSYPKNTGTWAPNHFTGPPKIVTLTTQYAYRDENFLPLTLEKLIEMAKDPRYIKINTPHELYYDEWNKPDNPVQSMFFSELGIPFLGSSDYMNKHGTLTGIVFYDPY